MSALVTPGFRVGLYAGNMAWHSMAFFNFGFRPQMMLRKLTKTAAVKATINDLHYDIVRYLGGINIASAVLAAMRLLAVWKLWRSGHSGGELDRQLDILAVASLCAANASQFFVNVTVARKSGRWIIGHGLDRITVLDTLFTILDGVVLVLRLRGN